MSYLVLARKYRPQTLTEVIGQDHIADLLGKAIKANRIAHAYLFCGPRGVGKTSCARILAKSLNCEKGPTLTPCNQCSACLEIAKGTSFDVLEIDGASNRGIDEIRTLRENVKFAPSYGRYKVYIVDEVHMLTTEAFNALLKTLEEPPAHVKFILATTAPNKLPGTILSRCQRFDFKRISIKTISDVLMDICKKEKFQVESEALYAIAKAADGSFRDALSILDQLSALSERTIQANDVFSMLGLVETEYLFELTKAIGEKNCPMSLEILEKIIDKGKDIKQLSKDLTEHFRNLMVIKVGGKALGKLVDYPVAIKEQLLSQCELFILSDILNAIDTLIEAQETARITESTRMALEVAIAKLTYSKDVSTRQKSSSIEPTILKKSEVNAASEILKNQKGQVYVPGNTNPQEQKIVPQEQSEKEEVDEEVYISNRPDDDSGELNLERIIRLWDTLTSAISKEKMSTATYLQEGTPVEFKDGKLFVAFQPNCSFHKSALEDQNNVKLVERIFSEKLQATILMRYTITNNTESKKVEDTNVKNVLNEFQGKVVSRWHNE